MERSVSCGLSEAGEASGKAEGQRDAGAISCREIYAVGRGLDFALIAMEKYWRILNND